jgi:two-component system, NtrC family, sensor kinase
MNCPRCQQENPTEPKFCGQCGAPLGAVGPTGPAAPSHAEVTRALSEALEQQAATADILGAISRSAKGLQPILDAAVENASRLCGAANVSLYRVEGPLMRKVAESGAPLTSLRVGETRPITGMSVSGRAILDRTIVHVLDHQDPEAVQEYPEARRDTGIRTTVGIPLLREDRAVGAFTAYRTESRTFSEREIALLRTFADQAVIAIENVRLFTELQEKHHSLNRAHAQVAEALEQQTATAEILRVISSSPTEIEPVLDRMAESAARYCQAYDATIFRVEDDDIRLVAHHGPISSLPIGFVIPLTPGGVATRSVLERRPIHVADIQLEEQEFPVAAVNARRLGNRTMLAVPLLREDRALGAILLRRTEVQPFTDKQIALLQTFGDQAVIAIENVRLFKELEEKNRALTRAHGQVTEALEQQTATAEILRVISQSPTDVQPVFEAIVRNALDLCRASQAGAYRFDGELIHSVAHAGYTPEQLVHWRSTFPRRVAEDRLGRAVLTRRVDLIRDVESEAGLGLSSEAIANMRARGSRSAVTVPMVRNHKVIGAISLAHREVNGFSDAQVELLKTFADQAVIAIENVRLFTELQEKNRALVEAHQHVTRALDQQTATSEILRTITRTKTDVQPVFETIVRSAARLCHAAMASVSLTDGRMLHVPANYGSSPEAMAAIRARFPRPLDPDTVTGSAILTRSVVQVPDVREPSVAEFTRQAGQVLGYRSVLAVPMLRQGDAVGAINVTRVEPGQFSDAEVELLKTFADQAVIAIENVRLFTELEAANRDLKAASQHKSEFLANMSHELRTPLNAIIGFSEVLGERLFGELNEKQEEYLKDIHASGQHLLSLINDILDLSKIEAGRMELELTDFHLPAALDNALALVRERAGRRGIALHMTTDERLDYVRADERKIRQVLLNLLSNAIKFTPEGGRIEVQAKPVNGAVEVSVSDTGVGIAPGDQEAIFEEFRQVGTADKKGEGTGLGLALSRKFIELHGGRIWVESQVGVGSTFTFTIPSGHSLHEWDGIRP